ncbi:MAG: pilin, partial [bacterium]
IPSALALAPMLALAQGLDNVETLLGSIGRLVDLALPIVVGIALLGFFWGLAQFVFAAGDEAKQDQAKSHMIWGVVALFIMVSVWGLVQFIGTAVDVNQGDSSGTIPTVEGL